MCLIPRFHPGYSAWVAWNPLLSIWDNPVSAISETAAEVPISYLLPHRQQVDQVGSLLDKQLCQPSLPAVRSPASREQRWSLAQAIKGTGKCRLQCWSWSLRVPLDYSWNCLGCFEVVEGLGVPLAGHVQGRVLHPKCSLWWVVSAIQGEPDILVRPGCPPCFASGHSAIALSAAQTRFHLSYCSCFGNLLFLNTLSIIIFLLPSSVEQAALLKLEE